MLHIRPNYYANLNQLVLCFWHLICKSQLTLRFGEVLVQRYESTTFHFKLIHALPQYHKQTDKNLFLPYLSQKNRNLEMQEAYLCSGVNGQKQERLQAHSFTFYFARICLFIIPLGFNFE